MALIKCIECGQMISDKSNICVHCGCPTNLSLTSSEKEAEDTEITSENREITDENREEVIRDIIESLKSTSHENKMQSNAEHTNVKCPKCGSTNITAGQRGYSLLTGFLGSGSTVNRCANCGYKWKPGK